VEGKLCGYLARSALPSMDEYAPRRTVAVVISTRERRWPTRKVCYEICHDRRRQHRAFERPGACLGGRERVRNAMANVFPCIFLVTSVFNIVGKGGWHSKHTDFAEQPGPSTPTTLLATCPDKWTIFIITIDGLGCYSSRVSRLATFESGRESERENRFPLPLPLRGSTSASPPFLRLSENC